MGRVSTSMPFHFKDEKMSHCQHLSQGIGSSKGPKNTALLESSNSPIKPKTSTTFQR